MTRDYGAQLRRHIETKTFLSCGYVCVPIKRKPRKRNVRRAKKIRALLDSLGTTDSVVTSLLKQNTGAFLIAQTLGVHIVSDEFSGLDGAYVDQLESYESCGLPSEMMLAISPELHDGENIVPYVLWASKLKWASNVQNIAGWVTYHCGSSHKCDGKIYNFEWYVAVNPENGNVRALKINKKIRREIYSRHRKTKAVHRFIQGVWDYPVASQEIEQGKLQYYRHQEAAKIHAETFRLLYNFFNHRNNGAVVTAKKHGIRYTFNIEQHEWKNFFSERIKVKTENGSTKPIFHWVSAHKRKTKSGEKSIKTHMRGLRAFNWNGWHVNISIAGKHGDGLHTMQLAGHDAQEKTVEKMADRRSFEKLYPYMVN